MSHINEESISNTLVQELLKEKRRDRLWKNIRFIAWFVFFVYTLITTLHYAQSEAIVGDTANKHYASLIRLNGMIMPNSNLSAEALVPVLKAAFSDKHTEGVILDIDSPGGTPVQASIIHDTILTFKKKYHKKVIVVGEDLMTSGAYYIACAADKIYVNPNTLTGSIGVIMKGFGFVGAMKKIGIERRVYTAGNNKDRLDPFLPQSQDDIKKIKAVIDTVHQNFEAAVLEGRKGKLHADPSTLFSGDFWSGQMAVKLGLVDGLGNLFDVMEKEFNTTNYREYSTNTNVLKMLSDQLDG